MRHTLHVLLLVVALPACDPPPTTKKSNAPTTPRVSAATKAAVLAHHADLIHATASDALSAAQSLDAALETLVASPSVDSLRRARSAWSAARVPYLQMEVFQLDRKMTPWPIDEAALDYVVGDASSGIINNPNNLPVITPATLRDADPKKAPTGFHAIEFLLWGQDHYEFGPGNRPHTDYATDESKPHPSTARRRAYLLALGDLLVDQLTTLANAWAPDQPDNTRSQFLAAPPDESLKKILTNMATLSGFDLADERLLVANETQSDQDELSRFSDTTAADLAASTLGIQNVWLGHYRKIDGSELTGPGLRSVALEANPTLASEITTLIATSVATARSIPTPFDEALRSPEESPARQSLQKLIQTLRQQSQALTTLAKGSVL